MSVSGLIRPLVLGAALGLAAVGGAAPAQAAAGHQQLQVNSSASDFTLTVQDTHAGLVYRLKPGQVTDNTFTNYPPSIVVYGQSFRVRYDADSGPYQTCQDLPNDGSGKRFTPSTKPYRIDYLSYDRPGCKHS